MTLKKSPVLVAGYIVALVSLITAVNAGVTWLAAVLLTVSLLSGKVDRFYNGLSETLHLIIKMLSRIAFIFSLAGVFEQFCSSINII